MLLFATHGREPFKGVEDPLLFPIFGLVNDLGFFWNICHPLLGQGRPEPDLYYGMNGKWKPILNLVKTALSLTSFKGKPMGILWKLALIIRIN
jgi:hypothetical protein